MVIHSSSMNAAHIRNRIAIEANSAAWGYTKVALLFFVSLLVTWVSEILQSPCGPTVLFLPCWRLRTTKQASHADYIFHRFHPPSTGCTH